jgi:8-oxo-dGTP pyrophosphatase MutT (NUDIX family)
MKPTTRYEAAIVQNDHLLLLWVWDHTFTGKTFWVIPGGGRHLDETEEECVKREALEETHLQVEIDRLVLDEPDLPPPEGLYERVKTYACHIQKGEPRPGLEPEVDTAEKVTIKEVRWFDLRDAQTWDSLVLNSSNAYQKLQRLRKALGYPINSSFELK